MKRSICHRTALCGAAFLLLPLSVVGIPIRDLGMELESGPLALDWKAAEADDLIAEAQARSDALFDAIAAGEEETYLEAFTADAMILAPGAKPISGRKNIAAAIRTFPNEVVPEKAEWGSRTFYDLEGWVVELGEAVFDFRGPNEEDVVEERVRGLIVWENSSEGGLQLKVFSWTVDPNASESLLSSDPVAYSLAVRKGSSFVGEPRSELLEAEVSLGRFLSGASQSKAFDFYASSAVLVRSDKGLLRGVSAIALDLRNRADHSAGMRSKVLYSEVRDEIALTVTDYHQENQIENEGTARVPDEKGIRVWRKGPSGWKVIFELRNFSEDF